jgi:NADH:ubiquinone oxidoreductase subunit C
MIENPPLPNKNFFGNQSYVIYFSNLFYPNTAFYRSSELGIATCYLLNPHFILEIVKFFKLHTLYQLKFLVDIIACDYPNQKLRFNIIYAFRSLAFNNMYFLHLNLNEFIGIFSINSLFLSSNWLEREVWDLFGLFFLTHRRLRRILTDYGFTGHPLRKDFPTGGFVEIRFCEKAQKIISEPCEYSLRRRTTPMSSQTNLTWFVNEKKKMGFRKNQ